MRKIVVRSLLAAAALSLSPASARADSRAQKYYYEDISYPFFAPDPARPGWYRSVRPGAREGSFPAVKSTDTFRVFVLGGSIAALLWDHVDPSLDLGLALQAALPSRKVELLNCGMAGYDSFREAMIEQEILEYSPDLIVFLTGHNEGIASAPFPIWIMRAQERLSRLSAFRALVKTLHPDGARQDRGDAWADARDATFARNLEENLRQARNRGVETAVVVPPRNYREPVDLGRTPYDAGFIPGWLRFLSEDYAGARRFWRESLAEGPGGAAPTSDQKAFTWGFVGRAEEKLGLLDEARGSFEQAALFERASICGTPCQNIIRRAVEKEGGFLVEADRMFRALSHPRMPGLETFNDRMHWKSPFNCLMSARIIASLRGNAKLGTLPWDEARIRAFEASCEKPGGPGNEADDLRVLGYALAGFSGPGRDRLSTLSMLYLQNVRMHRPRWFADVSSLMKRPTSPQAQIYGASMAPDAVILPRFYWHLGEVRLLEKDYRGAIKDISKALELDPNLSWARLSLAVATALRGDKKRARALLEEASRLSSGDEDHHAILAASVAAGRELGLGGAEELEATDAEYWLKKAAAAIDANDKPSGLAALERARTRAPEPEQLRRIGQNYRSLRETGKFLEVSDALLAAYPNDVDFWLARAEGFLITGRTEAGVEALGRAQALTPSADQRRWLEQLRGWLKTGAPRSDGLTEAERLPRLVP